MKKWLKITLIALISAAVITLCVWLVPLVWSLREPENQAAFENFVGHFEATSFVNATIDKRHSDIVDNSEIWDEIEALENETDFIGAKLGFFAGRNAIDGLTDEFIFANGSFVEKANNIEKSGFATAGWAHNHDKFAAFNGEIEIV